MYEVRVNVPQLGLMLTEKHKHVLGGAGEACWAHNPKVRGSKPLRATVLLSYTFPIRGMVCIFDRSKAVYFTTHMKHHVNSVYKENINIQINSFNIPVQRPKQI